MDQRWIVVADAARARIFSQHSARHGLEELHDLAHPESRRHPGDLRTGGKGAAIESTNASMHQPDPVKTTPQKHADIFAKEVAGVLRNGRNRNLFTHLVLIAEPAFLGRLRTKLDGPTAKRVNHEISKDLTLQNPGEIRRHIPSIGP